MLLLLLVVVYALLGSAAKLRSEPGKAALTCTGTSVIHSSSVSGRGDGRGDSTAASIGRRGRPPRGRPLARRHRRRRQHHRRQRLEYKGERKGKKEKRYRTVGRG
jgi:hypothetical protein